MIYTDRMYGIHVTLRTSLNLHSIVTIVKFYKGFKKVFR